MTAHNTVFGSKRSVGYLYRVHKLFTSCIRRGLVSREWRDSIVDGDWLSATEWYQR